MVGMGIAIIVLATLGQIRADARQADGGLQQEHSINLDISEAKLEELGMQGMTAPFQTSCNNHTGHGGAWIIEWDGSSFQRLSDHIMPDRDAIAPLEAARAAEYAKSNDPWPVRSCN